MKQKALDPNAIRTILNFGHTVYSKNGKAVFVNTPITDIDIDDDDAVDAYNNGLQAFSDSLNSIGFKVTKFDGNDVITDLPFETYSGLQGLTQEDINKVNTVAFKIDEMVETYRENTDRTEAYNEKSKQGILDDAEADAINKLRGMVYLKFMWIFKNGRDALLWLDGERFAQFEWFTYNFIIPYDKVLKHIVKRYHLSIN